MSNKLCRQAIETTLHIWAATRDPILPVAWQNVDPGTLAVPYLRAYMLPAQTDSLDLKGDHREYHGIYQITVVCALDRGPGAAEGIATEIADTFPLNMRMTADYLTVTVNRPVTVAQGVPDEYEYILPVSFGYRADVI